jgi:phosphatidate cytidylyltransferase
MTRLLSGVILGAVALAAIFYLPPTGVRLLACVVAALAAHEYLAILHRDGTPPLVWPVLIFVVAACWWMSAAERGDLLLLLLVMLAWAAVEVLWRGLTIERAAAHFLAPWYVGMPLGMLAAVHAVGGRMATLLLIATVVVSDSAQYYTGRMFGRRPLAPTISPKKTIEGAIGGIVFAMAFLMIAGGRLFPDAALVSLALIGLAVVVLGICGDLFESRLKRIAGVKDSSSLIPGHGGVLDRIDALLFATPPLYLYVVGYL